ncbi:hypothetical protein K6U61_10565, partial [Vibrio vulnificus]|nr:hypothetical protein [Vibrio vulnificus]
GTTQWMSFPHFLAVYPWITPRFRFSINLFHPENGGPHPLGVINQAKEVLYPAIRRCIEEQSLPVYHQDLELVESRFYKQATMPGAALIKQALYDGLLLMKVVEG